MDNQVDVRPDDGAGGVLLRLFLGSVAVALGALAALVAYFVNEYRKGR